MVVRYFWFIGQLEKAPRLGCPIYSVYRTIREGPPLAGAHMQKNEYRTPAYNYFVSIRHSDTLNMKKFFYILDGQCFAIREGVFSWKKS